MEENIGGKYEIAFKAKADGSYSFDYELNSEFFSLFEDPMVESGTLKAHVSMDKSEHMLKFNFDIDGIINAVCDVCLGSFDYQLSCDGQVVVKFGDVAEEISDELVVISKDDDSIDISQWLYDIICVNLPIRFEHPLDSDGNSTCDPEMLEKLSQYLVTDLTETDENKADESNNSGETDPRWDALKGLLNKNN